MYLVHTYTDQDVTHTYVVEIEAEMMTEFLPKSKLDR